MLGVAQVEVVCAWSLRTSCCCARLCEYPVDPNCLPAVIIMGNPIFEPESEQDEQSNRDYCRHDRPSRRRLDLARNPFRVPPNISPSDRRRAQVTRTSYRGDTLTIRGEICFSYSINKQLALSCQHATDSASVYCQSYFQSTAYFQVASVAHYDCMARPALHDQTSSA